METKVCKCCGRELPIENFKMSRWEKRVDVCIECATEKARQNKKKKHEEMEESVRLKESIERARRLKLCEFTPRDLMQELARRGYSGTLEYTRVEKIDITNF